MSDKTTIDIKEAADLSFKIIRLLNGLTIGQAEWVLKEAKAWLFQTHRVDTRLAELNEIHQGESLIGNKSGKFSQ